MLVPLAGASGAGLDVAPPASPEPSRAQATHHVHMLQNVALMLFDPPLLLAAPGDTVVFHSHDHPHTAVSGIDPATEPEPDVANLNAFETAVLFSGQTEPVVLEDAGPYLYYCDVGTHRLQGMRGLIVAV